MTNDKAQADPDADLILTKHADAHIVTSQEIAAILVRLRMLEAQVAQVRAQVEGLALGLITQVLGPELREDLARMLARTNVPPEEGTPRS